MEMELRHLLKFTTMKLSHMAQEKQLLTILINTCRFTEVVEKFVKDSNQATGTGMMNHLTDISGSTGHVFP